MMARCNATAPGLNVCLLHAGSTPRYCSRGHERSCRGLWSEGQGIRGRGKEEGGYGIQAPRLKRRHPVPLRVCLGHVPPVLLLPRDGRDEALECQPRDASTLRGDGPREQAWPKVPPASPRAGFFLGGAGGWMERPARLEREMRLKAWEGGGGGGEGSPRRAPRRQS